MAASYFDVDGTLVATNLLYTAVYYMANARTRVQSLRNLVTMAWRLPWILAGEVQDRRVYNERLFQLFCGLSQDYIQALTDAAYDWCMKQRIYAGARDLIAARRAAGEQIVFVSGALDLLLSRLAQDIGADHYFGNQLEFVDGYATGKLSGPVVAGPTKAQLVREHAKAHGHDLSACHAFADTYSEVPMLAMVGHPVAVNPDPRLAQIARVYAWPIVHLSKHKSAAKKFT